MTRSTPDPETRRLEAASDWLLRLQQGAPDEREIAAWAAWCEADPENLPAFERLLPLWQAFDPLEAEGRLLDGLRTLGDMPASEDDARGAPVLARHGAGPRRAHRPGARRRLAFVAAACTAAATVAGVAWRLPSRPAAATASVDSGGTQHREVRLPDGSALELGARSTVSMDFRNAQRRIELAEGQAFFTVRHDQRRPFVVRAGRLQVIAVGTAFDVLRVGHRVTVTVQEGAVDVVYRGADAAPLRAPAGYQVVYDDFARNGPLLRVVDVQAATAWRQGRLEYQAESLASVVASVNRYSASPVVLQDADLGRLQYTGTIEVHAIPEWLRALPRIFPVRVDMEGGRAVIAPRQASDTAMRRQ